MGTNINGEFAERADAYSLAWFENEQDSWTERELDTPVAFISSVQLLDVDADGDLDIVATSLPQYTDVEDSPALLMLENRGFR